MLTIKIVPTYTLQAELFVQHFLPGFQDISGDFRGLETTPHLIRGFIFCLGAIHDHMVGMVVTSFTL
jgi:hypothetical protein